MTENQKLELLILKKEKEVHNRVRKSGEAYQQTGYLKEDSFLADCMTWMRNEYPQLKDWIFHIENEGTTAGPLGAKQGSDSLAKGKLKGVFDVECLYCFPNLLFMECKLPGGTWSKEQLNLKAKWTAKRYGISSEYDSSGGIYIVEWRTFAQFRFIVEKVILGDFSNIQYIL